MNFYPWSYVISVDLGYIVSHLVSTEFAIYIAIFSLYCITHIGAALEMVGLEEIRVYIACSQNTVLQYIVTRPIMD